MCDYNRSQIYIIKFNDNNKHIYIGSTVNSLSFRFTHHKNSNNKTSLGIYIDKYYNGDWSNCYIELLEYFKCNNKKELLQRENELINEYKLNDNYEVININRAFGNKEYKKEDKPQYNKLNAVKYDYIIKILIDIKILNIDIRNTKINNYDVKKYDLIITSLYEDFINKTKYKKLRSENKTISKLNFLLTNILNYTIDLNNRKQTKQYIPNINKRISVYYYNLKYNDSLELKNISLRPLCILELQNIYHLSNSNKQ